jgi:hypothetical protein
MPYSHTCFFQRNKSFARGPHHRPLFAPHWQE